MNPITVSVALRDDSNGIDGHEVADGLPVVYALTIPFALRGAMVDPYPLLLLQELQLVRRSLTEVFVLPGLAYHFTLRRPKRQNALALSSNGEPTLVN